MSYAVLVIRAPKLSKAVNFQAKLITADACDLDHDHLLWIFVLRTPNDRHLSFFDMKQSRLLTVLPCILQHSNNQIL